MLNIRIFSSHRSLFFLTMVSCFFYSFFSVLSVSIVMPFVNIMFTKMELPEMPEIYFWRSDKVFWLAVLCAFTWIVFLLKNLFHVSALRVTGRMRHALSQTLRSQFLSGILAYDLEFFHHTPGGAVSVRLFDSIDRCCEKKTAAVYEFSRSIPLILLYAGLLALISWKLTLLGLFVVPFVSISNILSQRVLSIATARHQNILSGMMHDLQQKLYAVKLIKIFHSEKFELEKFQTQNSRLTENHREKDAAEHWGLAAVEMVGVSAGVALLYVIGFESLRGNFNYGPGGFVLFIAAVFSLIDPIRNTVKSFRSIGESDLLLNHVNTLLATPVSVCVPAYRLSGFDPAIRFHDVSFRYHPSLPLILDGVSLEIRSGEKIALAGPSGAGKSTLVDLLLGLYTPTGGKVTLDDISVSEADRYDLASVFGVITQETFLFHDTVRNNVVYNLAGIEDAEILRALKAVHLLDWLERQPEGLDAVIGARGDTLSGGEKQRLALARMILRHPKILIFDEATSALDLQTEHLIHKMILDLFSGQTIIFVSHRPTIFPHVTRILEITGAGVFENAAALSN